jgi:hypothetical protein
MNQVNDVTFIVLFEKYMRETSVQLRTYLRSYLYTDLR